ncbi:HesA/MoeB/ThiF family protein [Sphingomonas sp.]|uniref:HesA/MoeB/ThiF family protein n=1 Tax=Sphingomonas sp. TaxID=28214 RepID=UPI003D6D83E6
MTDYHLNPFCFVTDTPGGVILNAVPDLRVTFAHEHRAIVDVLIARASVSEQDMLKLIAPTRLRELVSKKVLLERPIEGLDGRYSRQLGYFSMTSDTPEAHGQTLANAHVLILGVGAIGSHVLWNLAAIGVGRITILDFDVVEESNFNRQLMYTPADLGQLKVDVIAGAIRKFNPEIEIVALNRKIESERDVSDLLDGVDLVVKAIDTPEESNNWVNSACVAARVPFVIGGFLDYVGVVGPNYIPGRSSCYACLGDPGQIRRLHGKGATFAPLTTTVASKIAMIAFKILIGDDENFADKIYSYDTRLGRWFVEDVIPAAQCPVCSSAPIAREAADPRRTNTILFRSLMTVAMLITVVLREYFGQELIGVLTFVAVLMSIPVIDAIQGHDAVRTRREFFVISAIYIGSSLLALILGAINHNDVMLPHSMAQLFDTVRAICIVVTQAAIGVTALFIGMCGLLEYAPKTLSFFNQDI